MASSLDLSFKSEDLPLPTFLGWAKQRPQEPFLIQNLGTGVQKVWTFGETAKEVFRLAAYLRAKGLGPGDSVALLSKNCAEWIIADLAIWAIGGVSVPVYPNLSPAASLKIIQHSDAKFLIIGKLDRSCELGHDQIAAAPPALRIWSKSGTSKSPGVSTTIPEWKGLRSEFEKFENDFVPQPRSVDDLATIIYTSGTTGEPKGAMHTFRSFVFPGKTVPPVLGFTPQDRFFSFLPLAHVAERFIVETMTVYSGATITFAESLDTFAKNLRDCRPTVFMAVPRIWQKLYEGVEKKVGQKKLEKVLSLPVLRIFARKFFLRALGLDCARLPITGASPMDPGLYKKIKALGVNLLEGYGLTENLAFSHFNRPETSHFGTVGIPFEGVETQVSQEGEVLTRSPTNMTGYYKNPTETQKAFSGEFLRTGDLGEILPGGFLKITGRAKDLFKTSKGKYIAPAPIELRLSASLLFDQVCVMGSGLAQPLALCVAGPQIRKAESEGETRQQLLALLRSLNKDLEAHEKVAKVVVLKTDEWSVENGILTPTLKVRRNLVETRYSDRLKTWVERSELVVWD